MIENTSPNLQAQTHKEFFKRKRKTIVNGKVPVKSGTQNLKKRSQRIEEKKIDVIQVGVPVPIKTDFRSQEEI